MENEEKEKNFSECYGNQCEKCNEKCQFYEFGMQVIKEKKEDEERKFLISYNENIDSSQRFNIKINKNNKEALEIINKIAFLYLDYPDVFDTLIKKIYLGKNQSEISKEKGVTRQAVSKKLKESVIKMIEKELGMKAPVAKREKLLGLTGKEFEVYKKIFVDGCTERSAALQLKTSQSSIHRAVQNLRRKLTKSGSRKKDGSEKNVIFLRWEKRGGLQGER